MSDIIPKPNIDDFSHGHFEYCSEKSIELWITNSVIRLDWLTTQDF